MTIQHRTLLGTLGALVAALALACVPVAPLSLAQDAPAPADGEIGLPLGASAPDFTLPDLDGNPLQLYERMEEYAVTLLHFFYAAGG